MNYALNAFDQYRDLENRLTRALGVVMERSPSFRKSFLRTFANNATLGRNTEVALQYANGGNAKNADQRSGIPDLALIEADSRSAVIIESKIGASLSIKQLASHERRASNNNLNIVAAIAITGRRRDSDLIGNEKIADTKLLANWQHVTWDTVYKFACGRPAQDVWAKELANYMEIFAQEIDQKGMGADVRVMGFAGIPFNSYEDFDATVAKRTLRSLVDSLAEDSQFLKSIGFKKSETPDRRKKISGGWDYLAPPGGKAHTKNYHFTIHVQDSHAGAMLTIPNGSFGKLQKYVNGRSKQEFRKLIEGVLARLRRAGVLQKGGLPLIVLVQRRYRNMSQVFSRDGVLEFDIRINKGSKRRKSEPAITAQPVWLDFCEKLISEKKGNTQFQIGVRFPYAVCKTTAHPDFIELIKKSFQSLTCSPICPRS